MLWNIFLVQFYGCNHDETKTCLRKLFIDRLCFCILRIRDPVGEVSAAILFVQKLGSDNVYYKDEKKRTIITAHMPYYSQLAVALSNSIDLIASSSAVWMDCSALLMQR
jgi:hypothetical protein